MKMKNCSYEKKLNAYLDDELASDEKAEVKTHLQSCNICQNTLRELISINHLLAEYQEEDLPESLANKIFNAIPQQNRISIWKILMKLPIAAMLIVSLLAGILISKLTFSDLNSDYAEFGEDSYYTYFMGEDDV